MSKKVMMNSSTSAWTSDPDGTVPKKCSLPNKSRSVMLAAVDPRTCAAVYAGTCTTSDHQQHLEIEIIENIPKERHIVLQAPTCLQGKRPQVAKASVTAGLKCAPEMWPTE